MGHTRLLPQGVSFSSSFSNNIAVKKNLNYNRMSSVGQPRSPTRSQALSAAEAAERAGLWVLFPSLSRS